ncbi:MAG: hypothetical protein ACE5IO_06990 [Thermoplasmata archaeon]
MARRTYDIDLKYSPEDLYRIVRQRAEENGWPLSGNARKGNFSHPSGQLSGAYEVRGNTVHVIIDLSTLGGIFVSWEQIERQLYDFFG